MPEEVIGYVVCVPVDGDFSNKKGKKQYACTLSEECISYVNIFDMIMWCSNRGIMHYWIESITSHNPKELGSGHIEEFNFEKEN